MKLRKAVILFRGVLFPLQDAVCILRQTMLVRWGGWWRLTCCRATKRQPRSHGRGREGQRAEPQDKGKNNSLPLLKN